MMKFTALLLLGVFAKTSDSFQCLQQRHVGTTSTRTATMALGSTSPESSSSNDNHNANVDRRRMLQVVVTSATATAATLVSAAAPAHAGTFTPGGTLVDRDVGATVGNPEASPSRKFDNSNVLFGQDHYFKFGVAAPWIEPDSTEFPKTMPFTLSQQRYDTLKKYGDRVTAGIKVIDGLQDTIKSSTSGDYKATVTDPSASEYALRPFGLMANGFLGSENTGTTNELLLSRWYINEIYLAIGDIQSASNEKDALKSHMSAKKAVNSYLAMINRVITSKVGDKFEYLSI